MFYFSFLKKCDSIKHGIYIKGLTGFETHKSNIFFSLSDILLFYARHLSIFKRSQVDKLIFSKVNKTYS